jgi:hypothetical protein
MDRAISLEYIYPEFSERKPAKSLYFLNLIIPAKNPESEDVHNSRHGIDNRHGDYFALH